MGISRFVCLGATAAGLVLSAGTAAAQTFLDQGTFIVTRGGAETAREEFAVTSLSGRADGARRLVSSTRGGGREVQHALEVAADYTLITFQQVESASGQVVRRISAQLAGGRLTARVIATDGETSRELPARGAVVMLGDEQSSAFIFVRRPADGTQTISLIRPGALRPVSATVEAQGSDTVTVAGRVLAARRFVLRASDGDERRFWFSDEGDLLRVARPADGTVATRAELQRR